MRPAANEFVPTPSRRSGEAATAIQRFSTDDVAAAERLDYWRDAICDVFVALDCRSAHRRGFYGHVTSEPLEAVRLSEVDAHRQHVVRGRRQLAKAREDDFILSVQMSGTGFVRQDGREARQSVGALALYATTRPYELIFPDRFRQLIIQLPRAALSRAIANPDALTARVLPAASTEARIFGATLAALHGTTGTLTPASRAHVAASLIASLAAALSVLPQALTGADVDPRTAARARICAYVAEHLGDPGLSPATIAAALGFSRGHVHRVFASNTETLERYVWRLRLERVRAALDDAALAGVPIADLAARAGFGSAEHFSRAFRARYGATARDVRRARSTSGRAGAGRSSSELDRAL